MSGKILFAVGLKSTKILFFYAKSKIHELAPFLVSLVRFDIKFVSSKWIMSGIKISVILCRFQKYEHGFSN
jgi:hypothetical protein